MRHILSDYDDPVQFGPTQLVTSSKLSKNLGEFLNKTDQKPIFIQRGNNVEAVLLSIDEYRSLLFEEQKINEIYDEVLAMRRLLEFTKNKLSFIDNDDVMKHFAISPDMLEDDK